MKHHMEYGRNISLYAGKHLIMALPKRPSECNSEPDFTTFAIQQAPAAEIEDEGRMAHCNRE